MRKEGLLVSQIGYDTDCPMRAVFRSTERAAIPEEARFVLRNRDAERVIREAPVIYWGTCWHDHWWVLDFAGLKPGAYTLDIIAGNEASLHHAEVEVGDSLLWASSLRTVAIDQFEARAERARNQLGWKDCGSALRELCSHAASIIGLCELANTGGEWLSADEYRRLVDQVVQGCTYLAVCQDKAESLGLPTGIYVHDLTHAPYLIQGDTAQAALALAYASRIIFDVRPALSADYIDRARKTFRYLAANGGRPTDPTGFSPLNHGAPEGFRPPDEPMTRDLLIRLWLDIELWISGADPIYKSDALALARVILSRQVTKAEAEEGLYGHFRTFDSCDFTEKANIHQRLGHDTGGIFPYLLSPFIEMTKRWYDDADVSKWNQAVLDFAYGYLVPACSSNPFHLLPSGYFTDEGLLTFCGPWHGINVSYTWIAVLATQLERMTGDLIFREISVGNIQWIAGLNAGLSAGMFDSCMVFHPEIPEGEVQAYSMIEGIGRRHAVGWSKIPGSIVNGFSVNPQFTLTVPATRENDAPREFTDEDWIPHAAGWAAALANLRITKFFRESKQPTESVSGFRS